MKYRIVLLSLLFVSLPINAQMSIRVRGIGIDIWNVGSSGYRLMYPKGIRTEWEERYYIPGEYHLWDDRPSAIVNKEYATTPLRSEDGRKNCTMESFIADAAVTITIAAPTGSMNASGWTKTSVTFHSSMSTYYLYNYNYTTPNTWVNIPYYDPDKPTILFGEIGHLTFDNPPPISDLAEGAIIYQSSDQYNRGSYIFDPDLIVLPNGDYIAGRKSYRYISTDKGLTWSKLNQEDYKVEHASTFYHDGAVYIIGDEDGSSNGRGAINKSTDGGRTWANPVLLLDDFRNSPSHVEVGNGRIWIAYENLPSPHTVNFLSASVTSDLMDPDSWVTTHRQDNTGTGNETDMVLGRDGWPIAMPKSGGPAVKALSATEARAGDGFSLPGSGSKYTAKYDPVSDKWWALTSDSPIAGNVRTGITLFSSVDLKSFKKEKVVIQGTSTAFHGFNYPSMQIDGDDIVFVLRTAWENDRGQAQRWHDANMLTFHRIRNFRDPVKITATQIVKKKGIYVGIINNHLYIDNNEQSALNILITNMAGKVIYANDKHDKNVISTRTIVPGLYLIRIKAGNDICSQKIVIF